MILDPRDCDDVDCVGGSAGPSGGLGDYGLKILVIDAVATLPRGQQGINTSVSCGECVQPLESVKLST